MNLRPFLRMAKWARNPPSEKRVILGLAVLGVCVALVVIERFVGWPDWLTVNQFPRR